MNVIICGYADDSSVIINREQGITESFNIIKKYELATGARLNYKKTSIIGLGQWDGRLNWPVNGLKAVTSSCKILGIFHHNNYDEATKMNWEQVENGIVRCIGQLSTRKLTLFQKALILNSKVLAKAWYISHIYPMPRDVGKRIERSSFKYLWNGNYHPINRKTMYLPKLKGGCGIIDINCKSKAIFFNTFFKSVSHKVFGYELTMFYCQLRMSYLFVHDHLSDMSVISTPYYNELVNMLRIAIKMKNYPNVKSSEFYWYLLSDEAFKPNVEMNYPLFDWNNILKNVNKFIDPHDRQILYKYTHEVLATKDRLYIMNITDDKLCANCGEIENMMHLFYFCPLGKKLIDWFKSVIFKVCKLSTKSFLKILKLDFNALSIKDKNTAVILISDFITGVWHGHKIGFLTDDPNLIAHIKCRIFKSKWILSKTLKCSFNCLFTYVYINDLVI